MMANLRIVALLAFVGMLKATVAQEDMNTWCGIDHDKFMETALKGPGCENLKVTSENMIKVGCFGKSNGFADPETGEINIAKLEDAVKYISITPDKATILIDALHLCYNPGTTTLNAQEGGMMFQCFFTKVFTELCPLPTTAAST